MKSKSRPRFAAFHSANAPRCLKEVKLLFKLFDLSNLEVRNILNFLPGQAKNLPADPDA